MILPGNIINFIIESLNLHFYINPNLIVWFSFNENCGPDNIEKKNAYFINLTKHLI